MGLVVVERFSMLQEAQVARAALQSSGISAFVADEHYGSLDWPLATALQGFRLSVPVEEFNTAAHVLAAAREAGAATVSDIVVEPRSGVWIFPALLLEMTLPTAGFLVEAARLKPTVGRFVFLSFLGLLSLAFWGAVIAVGVAAMASPAVAGSVLAAVALIWWMVRHAQRSPRPDAS